MDDFILSIRPSFWKVESERIILEAKDINNKSILAKIIYENPFDSVHDHEKILSNFFYWLDVGPYHWLTILKYKPIFSFENQYDYNIEINEKDIRKTIMKEKIILEQYNLFFRNCGKGQYYVNYKGISTQINLKTIVSLPASKFIYFAAESEKENFNKHELINITDFISRFYPSSDISKISNLSIQEIYDLFEIEQTLVSMVEIFRLTFDEIVNSSDKQLINKIFYRRMYKNTLLDHCSATKPSLDIKPRSDRRSRSDHSKIYLYNFDKYYLDLMAIKDKNLVDDIKRCKLFPPNLICKIFYSRFIYDPSIDKKITKMINKLIESYRIIDFDRNLICSLDQIIDDKLSLVE